MTDEGVVATYTDNQYIGSVATLTCDAENGYLLVGTDPRDRRSCSADEVWILDGDIINCTCMLSSHYR